MDTTVDKLLGGRVTLEQPAQGYRVAVDTLLLAASVPAAGGQKALELGCGVGGAMLALACRVPHLFTTGIEIQEPLATLCAANIRRNGFGDRLSVLIGDVANLQPSFEEAFDHVFMNPPYHDPRSHTPSADESKRLANTESEEADLALWIDRAAWALKEGGVLTLIHRADRRDEITALAAASFGPVRVKLVCSKENGPARRVIVRAEKKGASRLIAEAPFVLHNADGSYTEAADQILRGAHGLA